MCATTPGESTAVSGQSGSIERPSDEVKLWNRLCSKFVVNLLINVLSE